MNCIEIQNLLLSSDQPLEQPKSAAVRDHLAHCAACSSVVKRLSHLEAVWRDAPESADSARARQAFLARVELQDASLVAAHSRATEEVQGTGRNAFDRRMLAWAGLAAAVLLAVGLGLVLGYRNWNAGGRLSEPMQSLLALNLDLSRADSTNDRQQLLSGKASELEARLASAKLTPGEREAADALWNNAALLVQRPDPLSDAERFGDVADKLLVKMDAAAAAQDGGEINRLATIYCNVVDQGLFASLERSAAERTSSSDKTAGGENDPLQKSRSKSERRAQRIERLLELAPTDARPQLKKALEVHHKHHRSKHRKEI